MRARYDLGFGHPIKPSGITGVMELKAGGGTFDRLRAISRLVDTTESLSGNGSDSLKREEPLAIDFLKLLDPSLPEAAFRISWIALGKRGHASAADIRDRASRIIEMIAWRRNLGAPVCEVDAQTQWLTLSWRKPRIVLSLAWYRPTERQNTFESVFG
jgi:hypothetical protein